MGNSGKKILLDLPVHLAKDVLPKLAAKAALSILHKLKKKVSKSRKRIHFIHFKWRYEQYY